MTCGNVTLIDGVTVWIYYKDIDTTTCDLLCPDGQYIDSTSPNYCQKCSI
jgi:hypothetical protein